MAGVARHVLDVLGAGIPGWRIVVLCPPGPLADAIGRTGTDAVVGSFGPEFGTLASVRTVRRLARRVEPDVIHSHLAYGDIAAMLASPGLGVRLVSTEHGIAPDDALYHESSRTSQVMAQVHRLRLRVLQRTGGLIAVSQSTADTVRTKWHAPAGLAVEVIPNGIDVAGESVTRSPGWHLGSVSRLAPEKGIDVLLEAFARLHTERPEARLTLAGDGVLRAELESRARALGIADVVTFPGHVDASELLARLDVVVQLSVWENCSYALLDAMRAGCGVVATDVGGNPELLPERCLVPRGRVDRVVAAVTEQAVRPGIRPSIPDGWPDVARMCEDIAAFYDRVAR